MNYFQLFEEYHISVVTMLLRWTRAEDYAHNQPSVLWNAMVNPFLPLSIKGVIWYQGILHI